MWKAFFNIFRVKELRSRLLFTVLIIILVRFASNLPCPGVDSVALADYMKELASSAGGGLLGAISLFSGGALEKFAIGALGIMPYITSSIIIQLLTPAVPALEKIQREGASGRQKINQYTRYLTILVCLIQGSVVAMTMVNPGNFNLPPASQQLFVGNQQLFVLMSILVLTCTSMLFVWLGEEITDRGIGNGVSLIITINIIAGLPGAIVELIRMVRDGQTPANTTFNLIHLLLLVIFFFIVTAATVLLSQGYRRVPIQMVRKTIGNQMGGSSTYMPLKVNFGGVMPIIFAGSIMMFPPLIFQYLHWYKAAAFFAQDSWGYMFTYGVLIFLFSYFWVGTQFNPIQISENLKKEGAYIPGISPGTATSEFLDHTMTKVTFGGTVFLLIIAILPMFLYVNAHIPFNVTQFFGGTSLLIMVGVTLDTVTQLESHLSMRHYEGFLKSGRLRSRSGR